MKGMIMKSFVLFTMWTRIDCQVTVIIYGANSLKEMPKDLKWLDCIIEHMKVTLKYWNDEPDYGKDKIKLECMEELQ